MKKFKVGIIGFGLIGKKRFFNLGNQGELVAYSDLVECKKSFFKKKKIKFFKNWKNLLKIKEIDIIIISTYHNSLSQIINLASKFKKHILVEKPAGIRLKELKENIKNVKKYKNIVRVGYNHRYYQSILKCKDFLNKKLLGDIMFIKSSYGHGGRCGYQKEWRMNPKISGGGELIDQGSHIIDLSIFFLGKVKNIKSHLDSFFWKKNVDDNAFLILKFKNNYTSFIHVSCTEWKNNFLFEIYGTKGKLRIEGKGGSYGSEKLIYYKMSTKMGIPKKKIWYFSKKDTSWKREMNDFYEDIKLNRQPEPNLNQAYSVLKIIKKIYKENKYDNCS